jgi:hypothetical protein
MCYRETVKVCTRKLVVDTRRLVVDTRRLVVDTRRLVVDTRRLVVDTRRLVVDTRRLVVDTRRLVSTTNPISIVMERSKSPELHGEESLWGITTIHNNLIWLPQNGRKRESIPG